MSQVDIKVKTRDTGKQAAKRIRRQGLIPGVFYMKDFPSVPITAELLSLRPIVYTKETKIISLEIEGDSVKHDCVLKEMKFDPITERPIHFDLTGIVTGKMISVEVPIILKGQAIGVREGGVLQHTLHKVMINCLPIHMPSHIDVDISGLKVGKSVHLADIKIENVEFDIPSDTLVASVAIPRVSTKTEDGAAAKTEA